MSGDWMMEKEGENLKVFFLSLSWFWSGVLILGNGIRERHLFSTFPLLDSQSRLSCPWGIVKSWHVEEGRGEKRARESHGYRKSHLVSQGGKRKDSTARERESISNITSSHLPRSFHFLFTFSPLCLLLVLWFVSDPHVRRTDVPAFLSSFLVL